MYNKQIDLDVKCVLSSFSALTLLHTIAWELLRLTDKMKCAFAKEKKRQIKVTSDLPD